jgi:hypothetical protein
VARRTYGTAALSFLDTLSNGFGATILLFVIITARSQLDRSDALGDLPAEATRLEAQLVESSKLLARTRTSLSAQTRSEAEQARSRELAAQLELTRVELSALQRAVGSRSETIAALERDVQVLAAEKQRLEAAGAPVQPVRARSVAGEGERQYLTGLRVGGRHILILVDRSASMLDETLVNVIRARNLPRAQQLRAPKWQRTVATVDWLTAQLPVDSRFQIYGFNTKAEPVLPGTSGWLPVEAAKLTEAVQKLRETAPEGGTSLQAAMAVIQQLEPRPDNVYLLVDGLPTQGAKKPTKGTVTAAERLQLLREATRQLPERTPINVILFPMEGDPAAAPEYWWLSQLTGGSFLVPSKDWP